MSVLPMIGDWRRQVRDELLPETFGHHANALADLSFAMALSGHCHSGKLAAVAPGDTTPAATRRRLERTLANDRLDPDSVWPQLARAVLGGQLGGPILLILDETPNRNDLRCMKITPAYRKRALPSPKQLLKHSEKWQPHRSVAALYLWRIAETAKKPKRAKKKSLSK